MNYFYERYKKAESIKSPALIEIFQDSLQLDKDMDKMDEKKIEMLKSLRIQKPEKFTKEQFDSNLKKKMNEIYEKFKKWERVIFSVVYSNYENEVNDMTNKEMIDNELGGISDNESGNETDATDKISSHDEVAMIQKKRKRNGC